MNHQKFINSTKNRMQTEVDGIMDIIAAESRNGPISEERRAELREMMKQRMSQGGFVLPLTSGASNSAAGSSSRETIPFSASGLDPIVMEPFPAFIYDKFNCGDVKKEALNARDKWHKVIINHNGLFTKEEILDTIIESVHPELFVPFHYKTGEASDSFLISGQFAALRKLFNQNLILKMKEKIVGLEVHLGVAKFIPDKHPKVSDLVQRELNAIILDGAGSSKLNMCDLADGVDFRDIEFNLKCVGLFQLLMNTLNSIDRVKLDFTEFKFENNKIETLEPFTKLFGFTMKVLDLRNNKIRYVEDFSHLEKIGEVTELRIGENPVIKFSMYREKIFAVLPSAQIIDGMRNIGKEGRTNLPAQQQSTLALSSILATMKKKLPPKSEAARTTQDGSGNDPILTMNDGIEIKRDPRRRDAFMMLKNSFSSFKMDTKWSQVTIHHSGLLSEECILDALTDLMRNIGFYPCYYKRYKIHDEFFVYKNFDALNTLMNNNLELRIPPSLEVVKIVLKMNIADFQEGQVCWISKIRYVLQSRVTTTSDIAELDGFFTDPLFEKIHVPPTKSTFTFLTNQISQQRLSNDITRINAKNNNITSLDGFNIMKFPKLMTLDLRNNKISRLDGLPMVSNVKEVMLDNNPICEHFSEPTAYVAHVKSFFPQLEYLDGHLLDPSHNIVTLQNFLVVRDAYTFADEFCKTFFHLYDNNRVQVCQLYANYSFFSVSTFYEGHRLGASEIIFNRIRHYAKYARDISKVTNFSQLSQNVFFGENLIKRVFLDLPKTSHNYLSFCIDVPYYEPKNRVVITVTGTFDDHGSTLNEHTLLLAFSRTFVITPGRDHTFFIANDKLFIKNPTPAQSDPSVARKFPNKEDFIETQCKDLLPTEVESKEAKYLLFKELTELKKEECEKLLNESFWDIKVALATFITLMDSDNIPESKFEFK